MDSVILTKEDVTAEGVTTEDVTTEDVIIDLDGDVIISAQGTHGPKRFKVSASALRLACDSWRAMLRHRGRLGGESTGNLPVLDFNEDDSSALELLLRIAHLQFGQVPDKLEYEQLLSLALLTDKYGATRLVRPWVLSWVEQLRDLIEKSGYEEFIWITWDFGLLDEFDSLAVRITFNAAVNEDGDCTIDGVPVSSLHIPPGLAESILDVRAVVLDRLLAIPYSYMDRIISSESDSGTCEGNERTHCDALFFGTISLALTRQSLLPVRKTSSDLYLSIAQLSSDLRHMHLLSFPHGLRRRYERHRYMDEDHNPCGCNIPQKIESDIAKVLDDIPSSVTSAHREHIKQQRKVLGFHT